MTLLQEPGHPSSKGSEHPVWCVGEAGGCVAPGHQSAELAVPGDGVSGVEVKASLWSGKGGREFVALMMAPAADDSPSLALACTLAEGIRQARVEHVLATGDAHSSPVFYENPDDPEYITDPHAHDLTIDQAETLHRALGELLRQARHARSV